MQRKAILLNPIDNIAAALTDLSAGDVVSVSAGRVITMEDDIPLGHKFAIAPIPAGAEILKYGLSIGPSTRDIHVGEHVHTHNVLDSDDDQLVQSIGKDKGVSP